jgi:ribosomal protein S18 acetylase RimI-like enzyme
MSASPYLLRPARPDEIAPICRILAGMEPWLTLGITATSLETAFARDADIRRVQVAAEDDTLLGMVAFRTMRGMEYVSALRARSQRNAGLGDVSETQAPDYPDGGYVNCLAVFGNQQGRGIGLELLQYAEAETARDGSERLYLCVSDFNAAARRFYARLGYTEMTCFKDCVVVGRDELLLVKPVISA